MVVRDGALLLAERTRQDDDHYDQREHVQGDTYDLVRHAFKYTERDRVVKPRSLRVRPWRAESSVAGKRSLIQERVAQLLQGALLEARDVHLRDVEALGDLGLGDRLVEA
jgi:hypothetical protein